VETQLDNGIRFLDLRVKRKTASNELAMWHGDDFLYDPYRPDTQDQLYFRTVIEKCVEWLERHPRETLIISVKDEESSGGGTDLGRDVYRVLTEVNTQHKAPTNPKFHGMWHGHGVDCTLKQARGRLILWRRFVTPKEHDDLQFPGVDLTQLNYTYDNTKDAALADVNGTKLVAVQDYYKGSLKDKMQALLSLANRAYDSRRDPHNVYNGLAVLNFVSKAGKKPSYNAQVLNPLLSRWLEQMTQRPTGAVRDPAKSNADPDTSRFRSGYGVIPMDFPDKDLITQITQTNFRWTYQINAFESGSALWNELVGLAAKKDD
jgi:hypothetical protein